MKITKNKREDGAGEVPKYGKKSRFRQFEIKNHTSDPEKTGLLASEQEYEFGTPHMSRNETVLLVASNLTTNERLLVKLKWRPVVSTEASASTESHEPSLVTLVSELQLTTHTGQVYEFKQIETYKPVALCLDKAKLRGAKIVSQYGSGASQLKLIIASPYRRMRLVFSGHMNKVGRQNGDASDSTIFVKLGCSITPVGQIFDFLDDSRRRAGGAKINALEALYNDRHEHKVRLSGEYSLFQSDSLSPDKRIVSLRGFHVRHLSAAANDLVNCMARRLYVYLLNGKSFHLGILKTATDADRAEPELTQVGYTNFSLWPHCEPMKGLNKQELVELNQKLTSLSQRADGAELPSIEVHNSKGDESLTCTINEVLDHGWLKIEATTRFESAGAAVDASGNSADKLKPSPGWAWVSQDDQLSADPSELEAMRASVNELKRAMENGSIVTDDEVVDNETRDEQLALVVSIKDKRCTSSQLVGSKAASLAQLQHFQRAQRDQSSSPPAYRVPYGLVLTRHAYDMILEENVNLDQELDQVRQLLIDESKQEATAAASEGGGDVVQSSKVRDKCQQLEALVKQFHLPEPIGDQLRLRLMAHYSSSNSTAGAATIRFAVRSSSWGEDECDMSAAGQLTTILGVQFNRDSGDLEPLSRAIMECFASKFSVENVHYKRQHGLPLDLPMAVVVQEMVECDRAGVMFTCDPVTGDSGWLTITANYGLGESVVSAQADPDSIRVRRPAATGQQQASFDQIQVTIGRKELSVVANSQERQYDQSNQYDKSECCLSDAQILQLARVGTSLERFYSSKQRHCDIEFGYLNEQLFLFQCRPVTGLDAMSQEELLRECDRAPQTELVYYTRANVGEVAPFAARPLSLTYTLYHWLVLMFQVLLDYQPTSGPDHLSASKVYSPQLLPQELTFEKYHVFFSLLSSSFLNLGDQNKTAVTRSMEIGMFGREQEPQQDLIETKQSFKSPPDPFSGLMFRLKTLKMRMNPIGEATKVKQAIEQIYVSLLDEFNSAADDKKQQQQQQRPEETSRGSSKLLECYDKMKSILEHSSMSTHMLSSVLDSESHLKVNKLLANYIDDPMKLCTVVNKFLGAVKNDVISAQIPERIRQMAELIKQNGNGYDEPTGSISSSPALTVDKFLKMSSSEALEYLSATSDSSNHDTELRRKFNEFFQLFGHRCYGEFDIAFKTWREQPEQIIEMIKTNCKIQSVQPTATTNGSEANKRPAAELNGEIKEGSAPAADQSSGWRSKQAGGANDSKDNSKEQQKLSFKEVLKSVQSDLIKPLSLVDKLKLKYLLVPRCQLYLATRECTKNALVLHIGCQRLAARMLAREMHRQMRLPDEDLFYYLTFDELEPICRAHSPALVMQAQKRRQLFRRVFSPDQVWKYDEIIRSRDLVPNHMRVASELVLDEASMRAAQLHGTPASPGKVRGKICLVRNYKELHRVEPGSILLTHSTDIAFSPVFPLITGIITEVGGLISHGAVVAREYGLPSVIGIENVTQILQDGEEILLDADSGTILRLTALQGGAATNGTPPLVEGSQVSGTPAHA